MIDPAKGGSGLPGRTLRLPRPAEEYARSGRIANLDQLARATLSTVLDGPARGCRALDLRVTGGIDVRILPDRGFDVGPAWFGGLPLAWVSAVGESAPLSSPTGMVWRAAFGGGLVTTCGLRNVGSPSEGHGLHGRFSHLGASDVRVVREVKGGDVLLIARATIDEVDAPETHLRVERTIRTRTARGLVELTDVTTNLGGSPEPAPILYHVNLGAPSFDEGARLEIDSGEVLPRDADAERGLSTWMAPGPPEEGAPEMVFEHAVNPDDVGWGRAALINPSIGLELVLRWRQAELPRFHQWLHLGRSMYVLGLEPANCSVLGRAADRAKGTLPVLEPGERRTTEIQIAAGPLSGGDDPLVGNVRS
jgi:uncharacterized protein DUF4432